MRSKTAASTFPLRLPKSTRDEATEVAYHEGVSLNQFISLAVAEKLVRLKCDGPNRSSSSPDVVVIKRTQVC